MQFTGPGGKRLWFRRWRYRLEKPKPHHGIGDSGSNAVHPRPGRRQYGVAFHSYWDIGGIVEKP